MTLERTISTALQHLDRGQVPMIQGLSSREEVEAIIDGIVAQHRDMIVRRINDLMAMDRASLRQAARQHLVLRDVDLGEEAQMEVLAAVRAAYQDSGVHYPRLKQVLVVKPGADEMVQPSQHPCRNWPREVWHQAA